MFSIAGRPGSIAATMAAAALAVVACGSDVSTSVAGTSTVPADRPVVVATTSIWADIVGNVGCDGLVTVSALIPRGGDPHGFEPSLADRATMEDASLVVANGLDLEEGLDPMITAVADRGVEVFRVAAHVDTIPYASGDGDDPHVWLDPRRVIAVLPALADELAKITGIDARAVADCRLSYQEELLTIDAEIEVLVGEVPADGRSLVTNHDSLGYFADRYGFSVIGTVIPAPSGLAQTNPAQLEALARTIAEAGIQTIFAETQHSVDDADALAERVGDIEVVNLPTGSLGEPESGSHTYIGYLRTNARLIADALS